MKRMIDSELIESLNKDIQFDENGNVLIGNNLEIGGTTKLNGGLVPVFTDNFELQDNEGTYSCKLIDYGEFGNSGFHLLYFDFDNAGSQTIGVGTYGTVNGKVENIYLFGASVVDSEFQIVDLPNTDLGTTPTYTSIIPNSQSKLYMHVLTLNGKYWKEYITDSNLKAASIQDLDTITHAQNGTILVLGPELLLMKQGATWKIGSETVTTVSDEVSPL